MTTHTISWSEISTYRQCPLKHQWAYRERWTKPEQPDDTPLSKGTLWHSVMQSHYDAIRYANPTLSSDDKLKQAHAAAMRHLFDHRSGNQTADQQLVEWMYKGYVDHYGDDPDWKILSTEHAVNVRLQRNGKPTSYRVKGKIDVIAHHKPTGTDWIWDHKSSQNMPSNQDLSLDDQFGLYQGLMALVGRPVAGSLYNGARTQRNKGHQPLDSRFKRVFLNRTNREIEAVLEDAYRTARAMYPPGTPMPPYSSPDPRQCGWKCDFMEQHLLVRQGFSVEEAMTDAGFVRSGVRH